MGFIISTTLFLGTNRESHGEKSDSLKRVLKQSQNFHPICNQLYQESATHGKIALASQQK